MGAGRARVREQAIERDDGRDARNTARSVKKATLPAVDSTRLAEVAQNILTRMSRQPRAGVLSGVSAWRPRPR